MVYLGDKGCGRNKSIQFTYISTMPQACIMKQSTQRGGGTLISTYIVFSKLA